MSLRTCDRLRRAAGEDVPAEPVALAELPRGFADGLEPAQAQGERRREVVGARLLALRRLGQQQPRFQVGEPGRHHEIVGRKFEPQPAGLLDEGEVLLGERQDRDAVEIDLLPAGEFEQQVERSLEPVDVDAQRRFAVGPLGELDIVEG